MKKENKENWRERWDELKEKIYSAKKPLTRQEIFRLVSREAEEGNMYARLEMAEMYLQDGETEKAVEILKECEQDGIVGAVFRLGGICREEGDYAQAMRYYEKALEMGDIWALMDIGSMHEKGQGVERSIAQAAECYEQLFREEDSDEKYRVAISLGQLYENGTDEEKDYEKALKWYRKALEVVQLKFQQYPEGEESTEPYPGSEEVLLAIGRFYEEGLGVEQDYTAALGYYQKASSGSYKDRYAYEAMLRIGNLHENGWGVEQDYAKALELYREVADGYGIKDRAALKIAKMYEDGRGTERDFKEALRWYKKADKEIIYRVWKLENQLRLEIKHNDAQTCADELEKYKKLERYASGKADEMRLNLGRKYENGDGVEQDYHQAIRWYKEAEENIDAIGRLCYIYETGVGTKRDYVRAAECYVKAAVWWQSEYAEGRPEKPEERKANSSQAYAKAAECYQKDLEDESSRPVRKALDSAHLGYMYKHGLGVQQNTVRAQEYYGRMYECEDQAGIFLEIGIDFMTGRGFPKNIDEAEGWLLRAVKSGSKFAVLQLARLYHYETGDLDRAIGWYEAAAELDFLDAILALAAIYEDIDRLHDEQKAIKWYEKAVSLGSWKGMYQLAERYRTGEGVSKDIKKAKQFYRQIVKQAKRGERSRYAEESWEEHEGWDEMSKRRLRERRPFGR